jgi:hypothetical protein
MVTVFRAGGLRVVIFVNDHRPAHVHVFGDGEAKIDLRGVDGAPVLVWTDRMNRAEVRRTMKIVAEQQAFLIERWEFIHGRID